MRYMEGYPRNGRAEVTRPLQRTGRHWNTLVTVADVIGATDAGNAIRVLSSRLAGAGFKPVLTTASAEEIKNYGDLEDYEVEVQRTITTTVKVRARNEASAAKQVDNTSFPLPGLDDWETLGDYTYIVREPDSGEQLYEGDAQDLT